MISTMGVRMRSARRLTTTLSRSSGHQLRTKLTTTKLGNPKTSAELRRLKPAKPSTSHRSSMTKTQSASTSNRRRNATLAGQTGAPAAPPQEVLRQTFWEALEDTMRRPRTLPIPRWISPRYQFITLAEICGHASFVLVALSYSVDDYLMLRIIAVAGSSVMLFFTYWHPHGRVLWLPFKWNVLFIAINSYRIGKTYADRFFAERLSPEMLALRKKGFYLMAPVDFYKLVRLGTIRDYREGDVLVDQGESNPYVGLVLDGKFKVMRDGKITYLLEEANFIAESGLHVGLLLHGNVESCCKIVADSPARVMCWDRTELAYLMQRDTSLRRSLKAVLSWDIVRKLKGQRILISSNVIDNPEEWTEKRNSQTQHRYSAILHNLLMHTKDLKLRRSELNKYRSIHHIDDEHHKAALKLYGWTPEEFEAGQKNGNNPDDSNDLNHDWKWHVRDLCLRIFA